MESVKLIFQPSGRAGEVDKGITIIEASRRVGAGIETLCGEKKVCGKCRVRIEEGFFENYGIRSTMGNTSPWQEEESRFINGEEKDSGYRLGCAARAEGDLMIFVPEGSRPGKQVVSKAARDIPIDWNPAVKSYTVEAAEPTFEHPKGDFERILEALNRRHGLGNLSIDYPALMKLPDRLREGKRWALTLSVWMDREIVRVQSGKAEKDDYGLAVDIGTSTLAAYLCNLRTMEVIETVSMMNPQCQYGEDIMSRITYHRMNADGLARMSSDLIDGLNSLIRQACEATGPPGKKEKPKAGDTGVEIWEKVPEEGENYLHLQPEDIVDMTIVCNTVMHHILLKLNPEFVGLAPFPPVVHRSLDIKARDLKIGINESAYVHVLPNEAGFVGADNVGVLIAEEPYKGEEIQLIIDIGTNGELVLGNREKLLCSSCATGPALEGAQLTFGMRAAPGAIERIKIHPDTHEVDYKVIGREAWRSYSNPEEMKAKGICGSGILDGFAELYSSGIIMKSGAFSKNQKSNRFRRNSETHQPEFVIAWSDETGMRKDIVITQRDVRQIQLAKGALYTGCKLMMRRLNIDKVDVVKIAGAFGTHVDRVKALTMGLFPDCPVDKILSIGNAAGDGARAALLNRKKRVEAEWVSRNVEYMELTAEKDFNTQFVESLQIPHGKDEFPHLEGVVRPEILHQR
jgi:uncharacterized 2Fe-2S/4Fe-4S cluster protein (DUF4445 family)